MTRHSSSNNTFCRVTGVQPLVTWHVTDAITVLPPNIRGVTISVTRQRYDGSVTMFIWRLR